MSKKMTKAEIESKIARFEKLIAKTDNEQHKKDFQGGIDKLNKLLAEMEEPSSPEASEGKEKKPEPPKDKTPEKPKPTAPKTPVKKKGTKTLSAKKVVVDGKEMDMDSQEFCDHLLTKFKERRAKAKASQGKKKKTTSVMSRIAENIEKGIASAIKTGVENKKQQIEKNPKVFFDKVKKLETSTKSFLQELKNVLGEDYDAKEVTSTIKSINDMVADLKKKIEK